jgi:TM2 domain-containing membrane protein YozV
MRVKRASKGEGDEMNAGTRAGVSSDTHAMMMFDSHKKSVGVAYLLWFFLGWLGVHRFYAKRTGSGAAILVLTIVGWITVLLGVGLILFVVVGVWLFVDIFLIPGIIATYNSQLAMQLANRVPVT